MKKKPEIKYGIEIVKPWSSEMYDHNDVVSGMKIHLMMRVMKYQIQY